MFTVKTPVWFQQKVDYGRSTSGVCIHKSFTVKMRTFSKKFVEKNSKGHRQYFLRVQEKRLSFFIQQKNVFLEGLLESADLSVYLCVQNISNFVWQTPLTVLLQLY